MTYNCGTPLIRITYAHNIVDILSLINDLDIFNQVVPENKSNLDGQIRTWFLPQFIDGYSLSWMKTDQHWAPFQSS